MLKKTFSLVLLMALIGTVVSLRAQEGATINNNPFTAVRNDSQSQLGVDVSTGWEPADSVGGLPSRQGLVTNGCVTLTPDSRDFGTQPVDFPTASRPFILSNGCMVNLHITNITAQGSAFTQTNHIGDTQVPCNTGAPLPPSEYCEIDVVFDPPSAGSFGNNLVITYHKDDNPQLMQISAGLTGTGEHDLMLTPTSCDFFTIVGFEGYCTVTLQNEEPVRLVLDRCQVSGEYFSQEGSCPAHLAKKGTTGDSVDIIVVFAPEQAGTYMGHFAMTTDSPEEHQSGNPYIVPLLGIARNPCPPLQICCNGSGPGCPPPSN